MRHVVFTKEYFDFWANEEKISPIVLIGRLKRKTIYGERLSDVKVRPLKDTTSIQFRNVVLKAENFILNEDGTVSAEVTLLGELKFKEISPEKPLFHARGFKNNDEFIVVAIDISF